MKVRQHYQVSPRVNDVVDLAFAAPMERVYTYHQIGAMQHMSNSLNVIKTMVGQKQASVNLSFSLAETF
jgi:uncharacterized protein YdaL